MSDLAKYPYFAPPLNMEQVSEIHQLFWCVVRRRSIIVIMVWSLLNQSPFPSFITLTSSVTNVLLFLKPSYLSKMTVVSYSSCSELSRWIFFSNVGLIMYKVRPGINFCKIVIYFTSLLYSYYLNHRSIIPLEQYQDTFSSALAGLNVGPDSANIRGARRYVL